MQLLFIESCQKCPKIGQIVEDKITAFLDYGSLWSHNEKIALKLLYVNFAPISRLNFTTSIQLTTFTICVEIH